MSLLMTAATCLALTVFHEARGEPKEGRELVAQVILNRSMVANEPVCKVVTSANQFEGITNHGMRPPYRSKVWRRSLNEAKLAILLYKPSGITHFHSTSIRKPAWAKRMRVARRVGNHIFYIGVLK